MAEALSEEEIRVRRWRFEQLVRYGMDEEDATYVARRHDIDIRYVQALLQRGCGSKHALEIVL